MACAVNLDGTAAVEVDTQIVIASPVSDTQLRWGSAVRSSHEIVSVFAVDANRAGSRTADARVRVPQRPIACDCRHISPEKRTKKLRAWREAGACALDDGKCRSTHVGKHLAQQLLSIAVRGVRRRSFLFSTKNTNMSDDIANLLRKFGASAEGYLEVENILAYKEPPLAPVQPPVSAMEMEEAKKLAPVPMVAAVVTTLHSTPERIEPVIDEAAAVAANVMPAPVVSVPVVRSSLGSMLTAVAMEREAMAPRRAETAAPQPTATTESPPEIPAHVIAVMSLKGGVGKSTLSAALASAMHRGGRVIAIDLDPQNALQYHAGVQIDAIETQQAGLANDDWNASLLKGLNGTLVVPYGMATRQERLALEDRLEADPHWLAKKLAQMQLKASDIVILDTPPGRTLYLEQAFDVADQLVAVVSPDAASFMVLDLMERLLTRVTDSAPQVVCSYVVNQHDTARTFSQDMLEVLRRRLGKKVIGVVPLDYAISEGLAFGSYPLLGQDASAARQEVQAVAKVLESRMQTVVSASGRAS